MMANTEKGKEVRKYFLECERRLKEIVAREQRSQPDPQPEVQPGPTPSPRFLPASQAIDLQPEDEMYQVMLAAGRQELYHRRLY